jgi:S-phase kinase-associated protein 1
MSSSSASAAAPTSQPKTNKIVRLVSVEGESFDVPISVAKMSELVKTMIDEDEEDIQDIPLPNVKSTILAKIIEFCKHYKVDPMYEIEKVSLIFSEFFRKN